ncbi:hypothetical protein ACVWZA_003144 [Sphingomonas sp. UYAg733]
MMLYRDLEIPVSPTVLRKKGRDYKRIAAECYVARAAKLTPRQALFYRNLMDISQQLESNYIPIDFSAPTQHALFLDRGCVNIAVNAGFLKPLKNDSDGVVSEVELAWDSTGVWATK